MLRKQLPKGKQLGKTFHNIKITLLCALVTFFVLSRGSVKIPTGATDLRQAFSSPSRSELAANYSLSSAVTEKGEDSDEDEAAAASRMIDPDKLYSLGPKITDWDQQRQAWLTDNPEYASNAKSNILLVTGSPPTPCDNPAGDHYLLKSIKNKMDYCRLHGIHVFYNMAHLDPEMAGYWSKLPLLRKLMLAHPDMEWLWWMDSDAMFTDMAFELPMEKYKEHNLILHGWEEAVYNKKSWVGLNTGSFLLRNCQWSLDMLSAWAPMGPKGKVREEAGKVLTEALEGRPPFEADDQSALIYLLIKHKELWGDKVFLENSYSLHGYWVVIVETFEKLMEAGRSYDGDDERWPFVTHFVGCKPCGSYGSYSVQRCLKQMERAFNFGDNQILQRYGFQHESLGTFKVTTRTRNDTSHQSLL